LRARDSHKNDSDNKWFGYIYPKNLEKQEVAKLLVPRLVANLGCFADDRGRYYCDNVDVGGVVPRRADDIWLLAGVLNAPVSNTIFGWLSKPFRGDYKSANKQFIAPLPVPKATRTERAALSALAKGMQQRRTLRVTLSSDLEERLCAVARANLPLERILPGVRPTLEIEETAPKSIGGRDRKAWADAQRNADEESALAQIDGLIHPASEASVALERGKLSFLIDEREVARLFVSEAEAALVEAQWRAAALDFQPSGKGDSKRLVNRLRRLAIVAPAALAEQIISTGARLAELTAALRDDEAQLHDLTCLLFNLSDDERQLVERGKN
jgi:hypothetical protein